MKTKATSTLRTVCLAFFFVATSLTSVHAVPILLNGSFESPVISPNTDVSGGGDFWTGNSGAFIVANNFNSFGTTPYGNQYLGLEGGTDQQSVAGFLAGQNYVLDLFFADAAGQPNPTLSVTLSGVASGVSTFTAPVTGPNGNNPYPFLEEKVFFTPSANGSVTFLLADSGSVLAIDNLSLQQISNGVPDPGSSALLLGLGIVGLVGVQRALGVQRR